MLLFLYNNSSNSRVVHIVCGVCVCVCVCVLASVVSSAGCHVASNVV